MGMMHKESRTTGKGPRRTGEKVAQNTGIDFLALRLGVVLSPPNPGAPNTTLIGFGKRFFFWKRGLFRKVHFLEILENLASLEILENPQTVQNKEQADHLLEILDREHSNELLSKSALDGCLSRETALP